MDTPQQEAPFAAPSNMPWCDALGTMGCRTQHEMADAESLRHLSGASEPIADWDDDGILGCGTFHSIEQVGDVMGLAREDDDIEVGRHLTWTIRWMDGELVRCVGPFPAPIVRQSEPFSHHHCRVQPSSDQHGVMASIHQVACQ